MLSTELSKKLGWRHLQGAKTRAERRDREQARAISGERGCHLGVRAEGERKTSRRANKPRANAKRPQCERDATLGPSRGQKEQESQNEPTGGQDRGQNVRFHSARANIGVRPRAKDKTSQNQNTTSTNHNPTLVSIHSSFHSFPKMPTHVLFAK